jgi:CelD/BcsL family acetyltransferase involved in cellulose biosynthesis
MLPASGRVISLTRDTDSRWHDFVREHPVGSIYHLPAWSDVLEKAYGYKRASLGFENTDGRLLGVLPLMQKRGLRTGHCLSSLPHTPVAGPLTVDDGVSAALVSAAIQRLQGTRRSWLQLKLEPDQFDGLDGGVRSVSWRPSYLLELPSRPEDLRFGNSRNHARITYSVRKAERAGVEIKAAETEQELRAWYLLYLETMRQHTVPPTPYRFFSSAWAHLRPAGQLRLLLATQREGGTLLAGSLFFMFGSTVSYAFSASWRPGLSLRPNEAIHFRAIHDACREGYRRYDLGEVSRDNPTLGDFKKKWNARPRQLYRYYYPRSREVADSTPEQGVVRNLLDATWRRLPLRATEVLGEALLRYL